MHGGIEATRADAKAISYEFFIAGDSFHAFEKFSDSAATLAHPGWFGENIAPRLLTMAGVTGVTVYGSPTDELREALDTMGATYQEAFGGFAR